MKIRFKSFGLYLMKFMNYGLLFDDKTQLFFKSPYLFVKTMIYVEIF
jgi:hypothetical protein